MTSGYKCAKMSLRLSVLTSTFPQCHRCAFLKQTIIIILTGSLYILIPLVCFAHPLPPSLQASPSDCFLFGWFVCLKQAIIFTVSDRRWFLI